MSKFLLLASLVSSSLASFASPASLVSSSLASLASWLVLDLFDRNIDIVASWASIYIVAERQYIIEASIII